MVHIPIICNQSHRIKETTIVNNNGKINIETIILMWGHFCSISNLIIEKVDLIPDIQEIYNDVARSLFTEFVSHHQAQLTCLIYNEAGDEKGITLIKDGLDFVSLDASNDQTFQEISKKVSNEAKRILIVYLDECTHTS